MRIIRTEVVGLLGKNEPISIEFNNDLNIATGKNGAGKTTLLKLIWYVISGNVSTALSEVNFQRITIWTDIYRVSIIKVSEDTCRGEFEINGKTTNVEDEIHDEDDIFDAREHFNQLLSVNGRSLFFPTFRRIEGGFTIRSTDRSGSSSLFNMARPKGELQEAVLSISRRLSEHHHTFVTSISTVDVAELLLRRYTEMSEEAGSLQRKMSQDVVERIKDFKEEAYTSSDFGKKNDAAVGVIDNIRAMIESNDREREEIMAPLRAVQVVVSKLLQHSGIKIGPRLNFGDAANAINSDSLSAGEKQMLSFICYNAFSDDSVIFIDEPELSLHVDWQRMLFPTLLRQKKNNQFIIATHSPFIYSKYPDKEVMLSSSRGDTGESLD